MILTCQFTWALIRVALVARGLGRMAEKPEDLSLPASVVTRIIKDAVSGLMHVSKAMSLRYGL